MGFSPVPSPISASWYRSCELTSVRYESGSVVIDLQDEDGRRWRLTFTRTQASRVTTEECAVETIAQLPKSGGLFATDESEWLDRLGKGQVHFLEKSRHFVLPCYDEVVEVVALDFSVEVPHDG